MSERVVGPPGEAPAGAPMPPALARRPVLLAAAVLAVILTLTSVGYGYERDELYFLVLRPGWGYLDQPPLTPLLARLSRTALVDDAWAIRIWATLAAAGSVYLVASITREVGGRTAAQTLSAWAYAFASFPLVFGHVLLTSSVDEVIWLGALLSIVRARMRRQERWWLIAGVVVGIGLYNKLLIVVLLLALAGGLLVAGPRRLLWSRPVLGAIALALLVGLPNVAYQVLNGWPQLEFGRHLSAHNAGGVRVSMWPTLLLLLGPPLVVFWVSGLVALWRRPEWRPLRFLAAAFPILLVLAFILGTQPYYPLGLVAMLFAVGCVPVTDWIARGGAGRRETVRTVVVINALVSAVIALPLVPLHLVHDTPLAAVNQAIGDSVGWPAYTRQVAGAYHALSPADRAQAVVVASNYGEDGAIARYGPGLGLPKVYSAHNQLYYQARPPASAHVVVFVGGQFDRATELFQTCHRVGRLDDGVGVDNEEQGEPFGVCRGPLGGWANVWPKLKHED